MRNNSCLPTSATLPFLKDKWDGMPSVLLSKARATYPRHAGGAVGWITALRDGKDADSIPVGAN